MTSSGSQGFVRGRGGFQAHWNRVRDDGHGDREIFRLTSDDYEKIVSYLEIRENFNAIVGGGRRTVVGKKYGSKATIFRAMLAAIQHHGFPLQITGDNLQKRFQRYIKKYKDAREFKLDTRGGLIEEERLVGLVLEVKLERICPHFERMHALYGERPNVAPTVLGDAGVDEDELIHSKDVAENNGDFDDDFGAENVNPNTPADLQEDGTPCVPPPSLAETPSTLRHHKVEAKFWDEMEAMGHDQQKMPNEQHNRMPVHSSSCQCNQCRNFVGVHTGESRPTPTAGDTEPVTQRSMSTNGPTSGPTPPSKKATKTAAQAGKDVFASSKPSFIAIYVDRIKEKAYYRKDLIQSRDRWKLQDLEERRQARIDTLEAELKKARLERKHQLHLKTVDADHACKKARDAFQHAVEISIQKCTAEQNHEKEMAKATRKTALLTTLFGSAKTPAEIKDLLPIIDLTE